MIRTLVLSLSLALALVAAACGGGSSSSGGAANPAPTGGATAGGGAPASAEEVMERTMQMLEELARAADDAAGDCDAAAAGLNTVLDRHAQTIADAQRLEGSPEAEALAPRYEDRAERALASIIGLAMQCGDHPGVEAAMGRLDAPGDE